MQAIASQLVWRDIVANQARARRLAEQIPKEFAELPMRLMDVLMPAEQTAEFRAVALTLPSKLQFLTRTPNR